MTLRLARKLRPENIANLLKMAMEEQCRDMRCKSVVNDKKKRSAVSHEGNGGLVVCMAPSHLICRGRTCQVKVSWLQCSPTNSGYTHANLTLTFKLPHLWHRA